MHSGWSAFICILMHSQRVAFYMSCIQMHLYASTHKVHSVDTLHSDALAFLRIQAHSDAFTRTRIQMHSLAHAFTCVRRCSRMHSRAFVCIRMHSYAFVHIRMHLHAFSCLPLVEEHPAQLRVLGFVLGRAAPHTVLAT